MYCTKKVTDDLLWVGADDRRLALFEGVYGVPDGVSYNSYLLLDDKTVLMDTVDKAVSHNFFENLAHGLGGRKLDYLVVHHMEPDHAATVEDVLIRHPETTVVCNAKIKDMLARFFDLDVTDRMKIVAEGDTLNTGRHTLTFVMAPMVHWPEVMMSYDSTDKILFSADAFGSFGALNGRLFADEVPFMTEWIDEARRYYTNIVGKYGPQVQAVLKKAAGLEINYVCPLHSFVWRRGFGDFLAKYDKWSRYEPEEKGVLLAYASVYGHTENAANILASLLSDRGIKVKMYDTSVTPSSFIVSDAFKYSHLVFAATTYNAGMFVTMENLLNDIAAHNLQNRKVALIENGSWAPMSGKLMQNALAGLKGTEFIGDRITVRSALANDQMAELEVLADAIAKDIRPVSAAAATAAADEAVAKGVVDQDALNKLNAGLVLVSAHDGNRDCGCIANTSVQVSSGDPKRITLSLIKENYTCEVIEAKGVFNLSVLTENVSYDDIKCFGFRSGRDADKFEGWPEDRSLNGLRYIKKTTNAMISAKVAEKIDCGTHMLFIADVTEAVVLSDVPTCSVDYYRSHIKPKPAAPAQQKEGYICNICGYFHEGPLPEGFLCPLCNHGAEDFTKVEAKEKKVKKGYICKICGYFVECDGPLPEDYRCPLCNHGPDDFEPAETIE